MHKFTQARTKPIFVAEISGNHNGSLERARALVTAAANSGASAVKFQTYTADTMTLNTDKFSISSDHELWGGRRLYDLYNEAHTPWEWHEELFGLAKSLGIMPFSSPFDLTAVDFLESLDAPMYKIASLESSDHQLIRAVAATGKPVIISTGATYWEEIEDLVEIVKETGNANVSLLVCTSSYPSQPQDAHILRMKTLGNAFDMPIGLSDHTLGIGASIAAIALGASVIEKHLTLKRADGGPDAEFSLEPSEFAQLVNEGRAAFESLGSAEWSIQPSELESRRLRRSLYVVKDVRDGEVASPENVRAIRPGEGLSPKLYQDILGKKFVGNHSVGTPLSLDMLS